MRSPSNSITRRDQRENYMHHRSTSVIVESKCDEKRRSQSDKAVVSTVRVDNGDHMLHGLDIPHSDRLSNGKVLQKG